MIDKSINDARIYTDVQGLEQLRFKLKTNSPQAQNEVAQQFSSLLVQIMIKSMRDANNALSSGLFSSNYMDYYQDFFDKQLSLMVSNQNFGLDHLIEKNLQAQHQLAPSSPNLPIIHNSPNNTTPSHHSQLPPPAKKTSISNNKTQPQSDLFSTPRHFIQHLWTDAKKAAQAIGANPAVLLAQAALETDWGKKIIKDTDGSSSHNLFNIKADASWDRKTAKIQAIEQKNGILVKEKSEFRSYHSFTESFMDYVDFLKKNIRYTDALKNVADPYHFLHSLQKSGYATDGQYATKIMKIFSNPTFKELVNEM